MVALPRGSRRQWGAAAGRDDGVSVKGIARRALPTDSGNGSIFDLVPFGVRSLGAERPPAQLTGTRRRRACATLGRVRVSTPSLIRALMASRSTFSVSEKRREKCPTLYSVYTGVRPS